MRIGEVYDKDVRDKDVATMEDDDARSQTKKNLPSREERVCFRYEYTERGDDFPDADSEKEGHMEKKVTKKGKGNPRRKSNKDSSRTGRNFSPVKKTQVRLL